MKKIAPMKSKGCGAQDYHIWNHKEDFIKPVEEDETTVAAPVLGAVL